MGFHSGLAALPFALDARQEDDPRANTPRFRKRFAQVRLGNLGEEFVRQRRQDAGAIPRVRLATTGATVIHVPQEHVGIKEGLMGSLALDVRDESDATGVVFVRRVVEPLLLGKADPQTFPPGRNPVPPAFFFVSHDFPFGDTVLEPARGIPRPN